MIVPTLCVGMQSQTLCVYPSWQSKPDLRLNIQIVPILQRGNAVPDAPRPYLPPSNSKLLN